MSIYICNNDLNNNFHEVSEGCNAFKDETFVFTFDDIPKFTVDEINSITRKQWADFFHVVLQPYINQIRPMTSYEIDLVREMQEIANSVKEWSNPSESTLKLMASMGSGTTAHMKCEKIRALYIMSLSITNSNLKCLF